MKRTHYLCTVDGCNKKHSARGYCVMHWKRMRKHGTTDATTPESRFWAKVNKTTTCWEWTASCGEDGYGQYGTGGKNYRSHRYAYELLHGKIPEGMVIDHMCRNVKCVNPGHLEVVDVRENTVRGNTVKNKKEHLPTGVIRITKNRFRARKWFSGKSVHLGYYKTPKEASLAYILIGGKDEVI